MITPLKTILLLAQSNESIKLFRFPLIQFLAANNYNIIVSGPSIQEELRQSLAELNIECIEAPLNRTGLNPISDLKYKRFIQKIIRNKKPNLVLTFAIKPNIWGTLAAHAANVPSIAVLTGLGAAFTNRKHKEIKQRISGIVAKFLYRKSTEYNKMIIFQNKDDIQDFKKAGCLNDIKKAKLVNGSGVDLNYFKPTPLPERIVFLMVSRLLINKGIREYALAAKAIRKIYPDQRFLLAGSFDPGTDNISQDELNNMVSNGIEYLGEQSDIRKIISKSTVCVLPSYREGTPRSVLEAMAMGRPIITTDAPGCRETVVNKSNGLICEVANIDSLTECMLYFINNPKKIAPMGQASLKLVKEKFDVQKVNHSYLMHIEEVLQLNKSNAKEYIVEQ